MTTQTNPKNKAHLIKLGSKLHSVIIKDDYALDIVDGKPQRSEGDCSLIDHDSLFCAKTYQTINLAKRSLKKHLQVNPTGWEGSQFIIYGNSAIKRRNGKGAYILGVIYS